MRRSVMFRVPAMPLRAVLPRTLLSCRGRWVRLKHEAVKMIDGTGFGVCKYAHARFIVNTHIVLQKKYERAVNQTVRDRPGRSQARGERTSAPATPKTGERETRCGLRQPRTAEPPSRTRAASPSLETHRLSRLAAFPKQVHFRRCTTWFRCHYWLVAKSGARILHLRSTLRQRLLACCEHNPSSAAETGRAKVCYTGPIDNYGPVVRR
ncbi:hypothetical protein GGP41_006146 [Bipolaris sorokiniana]|uniref:Uncharacterized protein n=1 Tax=Cochliobolus sativus TaxID=45130 RepID=A0A8H6DVA0_COCSA|nr:hypothetical protein GGP41_006146 [Bipolaris sorokiniana]